MNFEHVIAGTQYARDVLDGKILACKWIRLACERHFRDLESNDKYWFDYKEAEKRCRFIELLPHTKGKWAAKRETIRLEGWQCFKTMSIFGWKRKSNNTRRYRRCFILEPRKNAKSTWAAGVGLSMFCIDGEHGAEIYSGATSEKQAWEVFKPARLMAMKTPALLNAYGIDVFKSNLSKMHDGSKFEPMIGNPGDGASPSCAIVDEYHEHDTDNMVDTMQTGMGAREQPLLLIITTAGDNLAGPCYSFQVYAQQVLEGVFEDDELFVLIYTVDKDTPWDTEEALIMANPNFGVSVDADFLRQQQKMAINDPRKIGVFKTKHLNMWVASKNAYFNVMRYMEAGRNITLDQFHNQPVRIGLDLASKHDITAKEYLFKLSECECQAARDLESEGFEYVRFGKYYLPSETAESPENQHYAPWIQEKRIIVTEGNAVDYEVIRDDIMGHFDENKELIKPGDAQLFQLEEVAFDPHQARMMVSEMMNKGVECVEVRPLVINFSEPMKQVDALIRDRKLAHDGCGCFTWMLSCVLAKADEKDNVYPTKDKNQSQNKIDGPVALMMVMARWMSVSETGSVYDDRGILMV